MLLPQLSPWQFRLYCLRLVARGWVLFFGALVALPFALIAGRLDAVLAVLWPIHDELRAAIAERERRKARPA